MQHISASARSRFSTRLAVGSAVLAMGLGLTGCGAIESFNKSTSDSWAVTYEVSVSGTNATELKDVSYLESENRGEAGTEKNQQTATTTGNSENKDKTSWSVESIVTAEQDAAISATPPQGATATCRILLDGVKEIAVQTGKPGERVECAVATPAFEKK